MSRNILTLFAVFVFGTLAVSANPSALKRQELTACIVECTQSSLSAGGCSSITDVDCLCSSTDFQAAAKTCLENNCTHSDILNAEIVDSSASNFNRLVSRQRVGETAMYYNK